MPRPKSFDPDTVLAKAMGVFWEKGYDAASISDLTEAMGINRFSLYDTFGDKHQLYLKALDTYDRIVVLPFIEKVEAINSLNDLDAYFAMVIDYQHTGSTSLCCMMHKAAITQAACDDDTKKRVECVRDRVHAAFCQVVQRIKDAGELRAGINISDAGWMLKIALAGLATQATCPTPAEDTKAAFRLLVDTLRA
ncbi:MAG: TetR/AcrR family transcriptional regulator [Phycisphaerales bacterium]|nr:TetR/AcrR family transcriptional regulator [Phycisphaerales bacterium]